MWRIDKDYMVPDEQGYINPKEDKFKIVEIKSTNFRPEVELPFEFRIFDGDDQICYSGFANTNDDNRAFYPLDDFAAPMAGCTHIKYKDSTTGEWEVL
jgi:hypothetical protein